MRKFHVFCTQTFFSTLDWWRHAGLQQSEDGMSSWQDTCGLMRL
jgi:hypothetical protein